MKKYLIEFKEKGYLTVRHYQVYAYSVLIQRYKFL